MKTPCRALTLSLAVLGAMLTSPLPATSPATPARAYPVEYVWDHEGGNHIKPGVADSTVRFFLGQPLYQPTKKMWVYHRFVADREEPKQLDCHNLLITLGDDDRVKSVKLINDEALDTIMKIAQTNPAALPETVFAMNK